MREEREMRKRNGRGSEEREGGKGREEKAVGNVRWRRSKEEGTAKEVRAVTIFVYISAHV